MTSDAQPRTPSDTPANSSSNSTLTDTFHAPDVKDDDSKPGIDTPTGTEVMDAHAVLDDTLDSFTSGDETAIRIALLSNYLSQHTLYAPMHATCQLVTWKAENRSHRLVMKDTDKPAILTVIAVISTDSFYLTPDAYYKGSTDVTPSLADIKLSCVARRPVEPNIANDFTSALANVIWFMEQVRSTGVPRVGVTLPTGSTTPISFKFRHVLFKVRSTCVPL